ncbi:terpenoid cyclases/protein prenyltransferase alpha-alpha toroid [Roridomyces roridus]|uniref:Terpenoid cyclases/protein prenyltransferase alpha-alpha toroid n=1 Tax=Roridomyces roridus TaxID=1738132 RepID=A0AAD7CCC8_9AGAR|nr:terpenoid cyclases/protein prenyltransferase alpha-alpha toroid [Roridomyces roridus]
MDVPHPLPPLARSAHVAYVKHALANLPGSMVSLDASRMAIVFYCVGSLDVLGVLQTETSETDRTSWRTWIWEQYVAGRYGTGFKPGPFMSSSSSNARPAVPCEQDPPHIIMTYTALLSLAILRDDFTRLNRPGLLHFLGACQNKDGSFSSMPFGGGDSDLRNLYCAFCICSLLGDFSSINVERAISFIGSCRTYEGGYGQLPSCEAQAGTTYLAIAALRLAPPAPRPRLTTAERVRSEHWLIHSQDSLSGGFRGRTGKAPDACYCFWGGAALQILGAQDKLNAHEFTQFIASCQFRFGGIAKTPGQHPDPYHTYLSLAAAAMYAPRLDQNEQRYGQWEFAPFDPLVNARVDVVRWARERIPAPRRH